MLYNDKLLLLILLLLLLHIINVLHFLRMRQHITDSVCIFQYIHTDAV